MLYNIILFVKYVTAKHEAGEPLPIASQIDQVADPSISPFVMKSENYAVEAVADDPLIILTETIYSESEVEFFTVTTESDQIGANTTIDHADGTIIITSNIKDGYPHVVTTFMDSANGSKTWTAIVSASGVSVSDDGGMVNEATLNVEVKGSDTAGIVLIETLITYVPEKSTRADAEGIKVVQNATEYERAKKETSTTTVLTDLGQKLHTTVYSDKTAVVTFTSLPEEGGVISTSDQGTKTTTIATIEKAEFVTTTDATGSGKDQVSKLTVEDDNDKVITTTSYFESLDKPSTGLKTFSMIAANLIALALY